MSDQNVQNQKAQLSLEEELDVLEAVYKIGMEKGLELLRPEQVKKLSDSKRINISKKSSIHTQAPIIAKDSLSGKEMVEEMVIDLMNVIGDKLRDGVSSEIWDSYSFIEKDEMVRLMFFVIFGLTPEDYMDNIGRMVFLNKKARKNG